MCGKFQSGQPRNGALLTLHWREGALGRVLGTAVFGDGLPEPAEPLRPDFRPAFLPGFFGDARALPLVRAYAARNDAEMIRISWNVMKRPFQGEISDGGSRREREEACGKARMHADTV
jgi:hypothetical protein